MEEHFRRVEFGMAPLQRRHSISCQTEEIRPIDSQMSGIRSRERPRRSASSRRPPEMPAMPAQAMEFLSRTWSPCSSDLLQILSPAYTGRLPGLLGSASAPEDGEPAADEVSKDAGAGDEEEKHDPDTVRLEPGRGQLLDENERRGAVVALARGTPRPPLPRRNKQLIQPTSWLNAGSHMRDILRGFLLSAVSITGSQRRRRRRRRDDLRLHAAQAHAGVSVAQLAAAVAGMVSASELMPTAAARSPGDPVADAGDRRMGAVLASAAALVATVCAEAAAESGGVDRARVASAVRAGRESRSPAELLALTATAATSLRGAAALELRAAGVRGIQGTNSATVEASLQKGTTLRVCLPSSGKVRVRTVAIFLHGTVVVLRLGKKLLRGAFVTYKEYEVLAVFGGEAAVEGRPFFPLALSTAGGATVQLLFEHQAHCKLWETSVQGMLSEQAHQAPMN